MNRVVMFLAAGAVLSTTVLISAQTTSSTTTPTTPATKPATPAKPPTAAKPATLPVYGAPANSTAKPATAATTAPAPAAASAPATSAGPSANQVVKPAAAWQPFAPAAAAPASAPASTAPAANTAGAAPSSGDGRTPVGGLGVGSFLWPGGWTLTAYGCFRTDTRLFCDFDTTNINNLQVSSVIWSGAGGVNLVDDGGKITPRHNAFFVGTDGSQFQVAMVSQQPVRFIIEYDDVDPRYTAVSLVLTSNRIKSVPVFAIDPNQPSGVFPARAAGGAQKGAAPAATSAAAGTKSDPLQQAQQTIDKTKDTKKKLTDILNSVSK